MFSNLDNESDENQDYYLDQNNDEMQYGVYDNQNYEPAEYLEPEETEQIDSTQEKQDY